MRLGRLDQGAILRTDLGGHCHCDFRGETDWLEGVEVAEPVGASGLVFRRDLSVENLVRDHHPRGCLDRLCGREGLSATISPGKGHGKSGGDYLPCVVLPPSPRASFGRTVLISAMCLTLWWVPVIAVGLLLGWKGIHFREGLFFSKAALVTIDGAYAVLPYVSQMAVEHYRWLGA